MYFISGVNEEQPKSMISISGSLDHANEYYWTEDVSPVRFIKRGRNMSIDKNVGIF